MENNLEKLAKNFSDKNKISLDAVEVAEFSDKIILSSGAKMSIIKTAQTHSLTEQVREYNRACNMGFVPHERELGALKFATPLQLMEVIKHLNISDSEFVPAKELKLFVCRTAPAALQYIKTITKAKDQVLEPVIARGAKESLAYALEILHTPFLYGEKTIAKNPKLAIEYAVKVLRGRFRQAEAKLKQTETGFKETAFDVYVKRLKTIGVEFEQDVDFNLTSEQQNIIEEIQHVVEWSKVADNHVKAVLYSRWHNFRNRAIDLGIPVSIIDQFGKM